MQHRDEIIIKKILSEIDIAETMMAGITFEQFDSNEMLKRAIAMPAINIGELIKNVTDDLRLEHKEVPWKAAAGMRDVAAHKYQTLRMEDVYQTATMDFPMLKGLLSDLLKTEYPDFSQLEII